MAEPSRFLRHRSARSIAGSYIGHVEIWHFDVLARRVELDIKPKQMAVLRDTRR